MSHKLIVFFLTVLFLSMSNGYAQTNDTIALQKPSIENSTLGEFNSYVKEINLISRARAVEIHWNIRENKKQELIDIGASVSIAYNSEIGAKSNLDGVPNNKWTSIDKIELDDTIYTVMALQPGENYLFKIVFSDGNTKISSDNLMIKTKNKWGLFEFLVFIGALGLLIYGMKIMSDGIQKTAGSNLRHLMGSITSNPFKGILTGFGITAIIQASAVTAVMAVSFVNAGLLTVTQSASVMLGADIGTTVTGWIVNYFGFGVDIGAYALVLIAFALPLMFIGGHRTEAWATVIIGFSLLFIGLGYLKNSLPELGPESSIIRFFISHGDFTLKNTLIFVFIGIVITIIVQSSSAAIALVMTFVAVGLISFEVSAGLVLGANIGTTITAELAAMTIGNVYAKRSARLNTLFKVFGVIWALLVFKFFLLGIAWFMERIGLGNPFHEPELYATTAIAILHTAFNVINVLIIVWFIPFFIRMAELTVRSHGESDEEYRLDYISLGHRTSPDLALLGAKKELVKFGQLTKKMSGFAKELLHEKNKKEQKRLVERLAKYEEITDRIEVEIANYLNKVSGDEVSLETAAKIRGMNSIVINLERIGDIFYQIAKGLERKYEEKAHFSPEQYKGLDDMFVLVNQAFDVMISNLDKQSSLVKIDEARAVENQINGKRDEILNEYLNSLSQNDSYLKGGIIYSNIFASLERIGDHIINVSEGVVGKI